MRIADVRAVDRIRSANAARMRDTAVAGNHLIASDVVVDLVLLSLEQSRLRGQLPHLSAKQRQSIDLAYFGGLSLPAISQLLALPLGAVNTRIRDGLLLLGRLIPAGDHALEDATVPVLRAAPGSPGRARL